MIQKFISVFKSKSGTGSQLVKGISGNTGLSFLNIILGMLTSVTLARILGVQEFGVYSFILSFITLVGLPLRGGLPTLVTREVAKYHSGEKWGYIKGLTRTSFIFICLLSLIITAGVFFAGGYGYLKLNEYANLELLVFCFLVFFLGLVFLKASVLKGLRKVVHGNLAEQLIIPSVFLIIIGIVDSSGNELTAVSSLNFYLCAVVFGFITLSFLEVRNYPSNYRSIAIQTEVKNWGTSLLPLTIFSSLSIASGQISLFLIGVLDNEASVALFRVSMQISVLVGLGLTIVNSVIAPYIVRLSDLDENKKLQRLLFYSALFSTLFALPLVIVFCMFGKRIIDLLFGIQFAQAYSSLVILSLGQLFNAISGSVALVLNMRGHEFETVKGVGIALILNIAITIILIPNFGYVGAAYGATLSQLVWNALLIIRTYKLTGLNTTAINFRYEK